MFMTIDNRAKPKLIKKHAQKMLDTGPLHDEKNLFRGESLLKGAYFQELTVVMSSNQNLLQSDQKWGQNLGQHWFSIQVKASVFIKIHNHYTHNLESGVL